MVKPLETCKGIAEHKTRHKVPRDTKAPSEQGVAPKDAWDIHGLVIMNYEHVIDTTREYSQFGM